MRARAEPLRRRGLVSVIVASYAVRPGAVWLPGRMLMTWSSYHGFSDSSGFRCRVRQLSKSATSYRYRPRASLRLLGSLPVRIQSWMVLPVTWTPVWSASHSDACLGEASMVQSLSPLT